MLPAEVSGLKNGKSVMAGVLEGDYKDKILANKSYSQTVNLRTSGIIAHIVKSHSLCCLAILYCKY